jgi:hypothetical protein
MASQSGGEPMRKAISAVIFTLACNCPAFALTYCANTANNQQAIVSRDGNMLAVNRGSGAQKEFLLMISFFGALRLSPAVQCDSFQAIRASQFSGIRIFPNWWWTIGPNTYNGPDLLFDPTTGTVNTTVYNNLRDTVRRAGEHGLVVDLSFAVEVVSYPAWYFTAMQDVVTRLRNDGTPNVMLDLQNEASLLLPFLSPVCPGGNCWAYLLYSLKDIHPQRLMTMSIEPNGGYGPYPYSTYGSASAGLTSNATIVSPVTGAAYSFDIAAFHDPRDYDPGNEWWRVRTTNRVMDIRNVPTSDPVYFQEPDRWLPTGSQSTLTAASFREAAARAKLAGVAAWMFHTEGAFCLSGSCLGLRGTQEPAAFSSLGAHVAARCSPNYSIPGCTSTP